MQHCDDYTLLERWAAGDNDAGSELLERHLASLHRFLRSKLQAGVDDLVQQTMLSLIKNRDKFRRESSFRTFLFTMARFELLHYVRAQARERNEDRRLDFTLQSIADLGFSPSERLAQRSEQERLVCALRRLPLDLQIALELCFFEDMTGQEIAVVLDIPVNTAYSRLRRAKALLRESLDSEQSTTVHTLSDLESWAHAVSRVRGLIDA